MINGINLIKRKRMHLEELEDGVEKKKQKLNESMQNCRLRTDIDEHFLCEIFNYLSI